MHFLQHPQRIYITALAFVLSLGFPPAIGSTYAEPPSGSVSFSSIRIDNFGRVDPTYYRGAQPKGQDYTDLAALGVRTVINLTSEDAAPDEKILTENAGMAYVQIPMTTRVAPTAAQLTQFLSIVTDPANQPVFVHCVGGRHRTGVMTAVYRITQNGWSAEQAFQEMKRYKFGADVFHPEFKQFVRDFRPNTIRAIPSANAVPVAKGGR